MSNVIHNLLFSFVETREKLRPKMDFLFFLMVLQACFHFSYSRIYIYHYNYTFNPLLNNVSMEIETFKYGSLNFSYSLNVWNHVDVKSEIGEKLFYRLTS